MNGRLAARNLHVVVDHAGLKRARTVEGDRCDDVGEAARWEPCEQTHVQRAFYLEQAVHVARAHEGECTLIVGRNLLGHHLDASGLLDVAARARKHAQGAQAKEVHLEQAQVRRIVAVILRDDAAAFGVALHGHVVGHGVAADDGRAGVHALAAHVAFDRLRGVDDLVHVLFAVVGLFQVGVRLERLVDGDAELVADHLADAVAHAVGVVEHARSIAHGVFRLQLAERDNARHMVLAVDFFNMLDDFLATFILEVDVDIGHLHAFGRQEALEQKPVGKRVEVGNAHGVSADGACSRATARSDADSLAAGPGNVFLHDEEVRREALLQDDASLVFIAIPCLFGHGVAIALLQAPLALLAEPAFLGFTLWQGETRQNGVALEHNVDLFGHLDCIVARLGELGERLAHLLFRLHVELVVLEAHAVRVVHRRTRADAQHDVLRLCVFLLKVVEVVRGDGL